MTISPIANRATRIEPWPSERPRFTIALIVSVILWLLALASSIGLIYAAFLALFFFILHLTFIAHVRGSAIRLSPDQFPDLHADVERIARMFGINPGPETYVMQAGGTLNAFATRFLGANIVVLFSDLLDACGDNKSARDMIIGHELGHVARGHLQWHWVLLPAQLVPFLGAALSRAREYTCDRYGAAAAGDLDGALTGLTILAAGPVPGPKVNRAALVRQREDIAGVWMTVGQWLSGHPALVRRLEALDSGLAVGHAPSRAGYWMAAALVVLFGGGAAAATWAVAASLPKWAAAIEASQPSLSREAGRAAALRDSLGEGGLAIRANAEIQRLIDFIEAERAAGRRVPAHAESLYDRWNAANSDPEPFDPYDGYRLGYHLDETSYSIWSSGPDAKPDTEDDVERTVELDGENSPNRLPGGAS